MQKPAPIKVKTVRDDLIESITTALLSVRNGRGQRVLIPDPMGYAAYIVDHVASQRPRKAKRPATNPVRAS